MLKPLKYDYQVNLESNALSSVEAAILKGELTMDDVKKIGRFLSLNKALTYKYLARALMIKAGV